MVYSALDGKKENWCPIEIAFNHDQEECYTPLSNIAGYGEYRVDQSVLDAAQKLEPIAKRWYEEASKSPQHSILQSIYKGDNRFYGLFYLELAVMIKAASGAVVIDNVLEGFNMEEAKDFDRFYEDVKPDNNEQTNIMELTALFLEDFKFVNKMHQSFTEKNIFLGQ